MLKNVNILAGYIENLCVGTLLRRLADNIELDRFVSRSWNQICSLIALKSRRIIIRLLCIINVISRILIFIPFSFLGICVESIQPTEERFIITE